MEFTGIFNGFSLALISLLITIISGLPSGALEKLEKRLRELFFKFINPKSHKWLFAWLLDKHIKILARTAVILKSAVPYTILAGTIVVALTLSIIFIVLLLDGGDAISILSVFAGLYIFSLWGGNGGAEGSQSFLHFLFLSQYSPHLYIPIATSITFFSFLFILTDSPQVEETIEDVEEPIAEEYVEENRFEIMYENISGYISPISTVIHSIFTIIRFIMFFPIYVLFFFYVVLPVLHLSGLLVILSTLFSVTLLILIFGSYATTTIALAICYFLTLISLVTYLAIDWLSLKTGYPATTFGAISLIISLVGVCIEVMK